MKLFVLNSKPSDPNGYIFQALIRALTRRTDLQLYVIGSSDLRQIPIDPSRQSLLVYGGEELHQISHEYLQRPFGRRAIWFTEDPYEVLRNQVSASLFHVVFSNDSGSLHFYRNACHLPLAADPYLIPKGLHCGPRKLLFFSGTAWPNRKLLLNSLLEQSPISDSFDLHLVANQYVERQSLNDGLHPTLQFEQPISISDFSLRALNSLCTLVVGRDFSGSGRHVYARSPGPRLFEAGITGSCQLVHASEIPDMPLGLEEGRHYLRFKSLEELLDLLGQAQVNSDPFRAIGSAMASEIQCRHTYDQRADVLLSSLRQLSIEDSRVELQQPRTKVLFISHEQTKPGFQHGGAGLCLEQIVTSAPADVDVRILCRSGDDGHSFLLFDHNGVRIGGFRCNQIVNEFSLHHPELEEQIDNLLRAWKPQIVHVNHFLGFTPAIVPLARRAGARVIITLHDYYAICDSWNLLNNKNEFCGIDTFFDDRCQACCSSRRPNFKFVDPIRRRIVMAEALSHAQAVIVPSRAAAKQLHSVMPHLPTACVIEPQVHQSTGLLKEGDEKELIVLVPGNLAINKGYLHLRSIINQSNELALSIQFRILGRVEGWIEEELAFYPNVQLLGLYDKNNFLTKASGVDLALFLSPWPETYCITFDEWKMTGRPCLFLAIGALEEPHRHTGLHQASSGFAVEDVDGLMRALINASTPAGLQRVREPNQSTPGVDENISFGLQHWSIFADLLNSKNEFLPTHWQKHTLTTWVDEHLLTPSLFDRIKSFAYRFPGGSKIIALYRVLRGR